MKNIKVVCGIGLGDESKGKNILTEALKSPGLPVIRFNGGSQAGHTCKLKNGLEHIFSHFGSGTFANCPTVLGPKFVCHPSNFRVEREALVEKGFEPEIFVHPNCNITTFADVYFNRYLEDKRGENRHGSVGYGIGETINRGSFSNQEYKTFYASSSIYGSSPSKFREWVKLRCDTLNVPFEESLCDLSCQEEDWEYFKKHTKVLEYNYLPSHDTLIFEGSQGLGLDQEWGVMPHCTPSNCGLKNVQEIIKFYNLSNYKKEVKYITRSYATRHGAGPLLGEKECPDWVTRHSDGDSIYTGKFRYAPLNLELIKKNGIKDYFKYGEGFEPKVHISCIDQTGYEVPTVSESKGFEKKDLRTNSFPSLFDLEFSDSPFSDF